MTSMTEIIVKRAMITLLTTLESLKPRGRNKETIVNLATVRTYLSEASMMSTFKKAYFHLSREST